MTNFNSPPQSPTVASSLELCLKSVHVKLGNIIQMRVKAIVNAANESLLGGGGVDGAIHKASGPRLLEHCRTLNGCQTGLAKLTPSFDLQSTGIEHIIHTVGPVWQGEHDQIGLREEEKLSNRMEDVLLASCYQQSLNLVVQHKIDSVAFPGISTGIYGFPKARAAKIAIGHVLGHLLQQKHDDGLTEAYPKQVIFCCFSQEDVDIYEETIATKDTWMFNRKRG